MRDVRMYSHFHTTTAAQTNPSTTATPLPAAAPATSRITADTPKLAKTEALSHWEGRPDQIVFSPWSGFAEFGVNDRLVRAEESSVSSRRLIGGGGLPVEAPTAYLGRDVVSTHECRTMYDAARSVEEAPDAGCHSSASERPWTPKPASSGHLKTGQLMVGAPGR